MEVTSTDAGNCGSALRALWVKLRTHLHDVDGLATLHLIEPGTFDPLAGLVKGPPNHIFEPEENEFEFGRFRVEEVSVLA